MRLAWKLIAAMLALAVVAIFVSVDVSRVAGIVLGFIVVAIGMLVV